MLVACRRSWPRWYPAGARERAMRPLRCIVVPRAAPEAPRGPMTDPRTPR